MTNKRVKRNINKELMFNKIMPSYPTSIQNGYYRDNASPSYDRAAVKHEKTEVGLSDEIIKQGTAFINRDAAVHTPRSSENFAGFPNELTGSEIKRTEKNSLYSQNTIFAQNKITSDPTQVYTDNQPGSYSQQSFSKQSEPVQTYQKQPEMISRINQNDMINEQYQNRPEKDNVFSSEAPVTQYDPDSGSNRYLQAFIQQLAEQRAASEISQTQVHTAVKTAEPVKKEPNEVYTSYERAKIKETPKFINVTKQIVYSSIEAMMKKFNCCTCDLCKQAVILDTLNNVKAEYVFKKQSEISELIKDKDMTEINKQLIRTIVKIKANPPHNK